MMVYLKNMAGFKMEYFKGMSYDDIHLIFEKYFNSNVAFLEKSKEELEEEKSRAFKRQSESLEEKAAKKQMLDEEVEELKKHLQIVPNDDDDVYTEATPLALKTYCCLYKLMLLDDAADIKLRLLEQSAAVESLSPQVVSVAKLPILNPNEFDLWKMRIEQYFLMTDYSLWKVILNGDSPIPTRVIEGVVQPVAPITAEQRLARKNELKAHDTLLMALPDKHQLKFNIHKDAKTLMEAIEKSFYGNKETKKVQKTLLKQQYKNFTCSSSESLDQIHDRNKTDLKDQSLDDLFNSLKIYKVEVKSSSSASTSTQNIAFVSSQNTDSTNESVSAVASVFDASAKFNSAQLDNDDLKQIDPDDLEERDLKWQMAMLTMRAKRFLQKTKMNLGANGTTLIGFDMSKAEEEPTNYALMAFTSSSFSSDNELRDNALVVLRQKFKKAEQERDKLKLKLEKFQTSSKNLSQLLASQTNDKTKLGYDNQVFTSSMFDCDEMFSSKTDESLPASPIYDRYQSGEEYHAVPPPYTGTFMPPKPDLVFHDAPTMNETVPTAFNDSDSEDDSEAERTKNAPSFVQPTKHVKTPRPSVKPAEHLIPADHLRKDFPKSKGYSNNRNRKAYQGQPRKNINRRPSPKPSTFTLKVTTVKALKVNAVKGVQGNWVWKPKCPILYHVSRHTSASMTLKRFDYNDALRRSKTNGGYVAFGGNPKGGKISSKGKIRTGKLDFDDVYLVKELKFNLFSISQMYDKKNNVLFTDTECLILSLVKLPNENQVLLRVPKENNMYNVDLKNIDPSGDLTFSLQSIKVNGVTDDALRLYLFPNSLTYHATSWIDRLLRNSINTFEQTAKMFLEKYFPPSMVTKLRNEITNFRQRPNESLFEVWERYKLSIDRSQRSESSSSITSSSDTEIAALKAKMVEINKNLMRVLQVNQQVKSVTPSYETCGGPHSFSDCPAAVGNTQNVYATGAYQGNNQGRNQFFQGANQSQNQPPSYQAPAYQAPVYQASIHQPQIPQPQVVTTNEFTNFMKANDAILKNMQTNMTSLTNSNLELKNMFGQFMKMNTTSSLGLGTLLGNTITNPKEDLKGITTRSRTEYLGPTIPTTHYSIPVVECETKATKDTVHPTNNESTKDVQPPVVLTESLILTFEPVISLIIEPVASPVSAPRPNQRPLIPYPSRLHDQKLLLLKKLPKKLRDLCKFLILCDFHGMAECLALADLGASINLMPLSMWNKLSLPDLSPTCMTLELPNRSISHPVGVAEDVFVKVGELTLRVGKEAITFNFDQTSRHSANYNDMTAKRIDVIDMDCKEYSQEVLSFSDVIAKVDAFLALEDDPTSPEVDQSYVDTEGDILLLKAFLNDDPSLPPPSQGNYLLDIRKKLKICKAKSDKSSIDEPPEVELKDLPLHLEYTFLEGDNKFPVIITKDLSVEEKNALTTVLKSHKRAITWKLSDIKGIDPECGTHKILMEKDFEPAVQHQRRVNPKIYDVIKQEVLKLLDAGLIYPISDSPWVSPVHCVPKKGGFTVVENEDNEFIPTRLVMRWRVCIDYRISKFPSIRKIRRKPHSLVHTERLLTAACLLGYAMHQARFREKMLKRCEDTNLCLNWEKSHFMVKEGIVLGHKISKEGIEVDKVKVEVITKLPHLKTVKGIQSFLGHAGFYRCFIKDFSKIARPMTRLLKKDTQFLFSKECVEAFQTLKRKFTEAPILIAPD
nr:hypothetical protein [Tanacetum cinerariifolium]